MPSFSTCDLCDAHEERLLDGRIRVVEPGYLSFGRRTHFHGRASTLAVFEDNALVRRALQQPGEGRVLVIDGRGSLRVALLGGNLAGLAAASGWSGVIVNGAVRDVEELNEVEIGIRALGVSPRRGAKEGSGESDVRVEFSGVAIDSGSFVYADADGIIVSREELG